MHGMLSRGLVVGLIAVGAPGAHAGVDYDYRGGCSFAVANDQTPGEQMGGPRVWNGTVLTTVVAMRSDHVRPAPTATVMVWCELLINGVSQGSVDAPPPGVGVVADVAQFQFTAAMTDVPTICSHVAVQGEAEVRCADVGYTQAVPQPMLDMYDAIGALGNVAACLALGTFAPGAGPVAVAPDGSVTVSGSRVYNCSASGPDGIEQILVTTLRYVVQDD